MHDLHLHNRNVLQQAVPSKGGGSGQEKTRQMEGSKESPLNLLAPFHLTLAVCQGIM